MVRHTEKRPRKSWIVWEEKGQYPHVIVECLSDSTAKTDRSFKKTLYQDVFRTPDYFWFDPDSLEFEGFHLQNGVYEPIPLNGDGHRWSEELDLFLGVLDGKLRFFSPEGRLVPTPEEVARAERQQVVAERRRAEAAQTESERLRAKLRALGVDPDA